MPKTHKLFAYGTLRDPSVQKALFLAEIPMQSATLKGWRLLLGQDGYLFIKPEAGSYVQGAVLSLTEDQISRADQWEDVPKYIRESVLVSLANGTSEQVWVYTRREADGEWFKESGLSALEPEEVLKAASALASRLRQRTRGQSRRGQNQRGAS